MHDATVIAAHAPQGVDPLAWRRHVQSLGMWLFLGTVTMLFAAFSSAYIIRAASTDWQPVELPWIVWLNTGVILASSACLELARSRARRGSWNEARGWLSITLVFGLSFLAGQVATWRVLQASGVGLPSGPHAAFVFILTGLHGLHLTAGLAVLAVAGLRLAASTRSRPTRPEAVFAASGRVELGALLWHFLAGLWLYLLLMLTVLS